MRLGIFVDLHGADPTDIVDHLNYEKVDLLLVSGDFVSCKNRNLEGILDRIVSESNKKVVVIPGNYESPIEWKNTLEKLTKEYNNIIDNNMKKFEFNGYSIVSYGGGTVIPSCVSEIYRINPTLDVNKLVPKMDSRTILQLHEPPKYYGDTACAYVGMGKIIPLPCDHPLAKKVNAGHEWLTYLIEGELGAPKPRLVTAGHIHEARVVQEIGSRKKVNESYNLFINPGPAMNGYYAVVEVDEDKTKAFSKKLEF